MKERALSENLDLREKKLSDIETQYSARNATRWKDSELSVLSGHASNSHSNVHRQNHPSTGYTAAVCTTFPPHCREK